MKRRQRQTKRSNGSFNALLHPSISSSIQLRSRTASQSRILAFHIIHVCLLAKRIFVGEVQRNETRKVKIDGVDTNSSAHFIRLLFFVNIKDIFKFQFIDIWKFALKFDTKRIGEGWVRSIGFGSVPFIHTPYNQMLIKETEMTCRPKERRRDKEADGQTSRTLHIITLSLFVRFLFYLLAFKYNTTVKY